MEERRLLHIGDTGHFYRTISESDVFQFAGLTGDFSRLHVDHEFAKKTRFGQRIAHGLLSSSFISTVMGMSLPGSGTIFLDETVAFKAPVFFGDTITTTVELVGVVEKQNCYIGEFKGICSNQRHETVCEATCHQMMPKDLFVVEMS